MARTPKIVVPGLNRGVGIPGGYILGRRRGANQGPAQLLDLTEVVGIGIQTIEGSSQGDITTASTAASQTASLSTSISGQISSVVSTNVTQSTSLSQISSSLSGAISSTSSLSTAVSTVISGSISTVNSRIDSLSAAVGGGSAISIQDEGIAVSTATTLNFTGAGVSATAGAPGIVIVDIPAGAAASSTSLSQISSSLSSEISSRISGDSSLSTVISSETSSRASGDTSLSTVISGSISTVNSRIDSLSTAVGAGGGYPSGTSFPGSPSTGDRYLRTDRNILYFYDGTRWLSDGLPEVMWFHGLPVGYTASLSPIARRPNPWAGLYGIYVEEIVTAWIFVGGAFSWTVTYNYNDAATTTALGTETITTGTSGQHQSVRQTVNVALASTVDDFDVAITENSGAVTFIPMASFTYRLIG